MPVVDDVERARLGHLAHADEAARGAAADALAQPGLVREHRALLGVGGARRGQRLDRHQLARRRIARLQQPVHAVVGDQRGDREAVERGRRPSAARAPAAAAHGAARRRAGRRRGRARAAPARWRCRRCRRRARRAPALSLAACASAPSAASRASASRFSAPMHAVAGQHEAVAGLQVALAVVDVHTVVEADRARQLALRRSGWSKPWSVDELLELAAAQPPGAAVADMRQRPAVALQHQRGERRHAAPSGRCRLSVGQPGVLRADQAVERDGRLPGVGRGEEVLDQRHHAGLRGLAGRRRRTTRRRPAPRSGRARPRAARRAARRRNPRCVRAARARWRSRCQPRTIIGAPSPGIDLAERELA